LEIGRQRPPCCTTGRSTQSRFCPRTKSRILDSTEVGSGLNYYRMFILPRGGIVNIFIIFSHVK